MTLLRDQNKALRIGVNHGSLAERMLFTYGDTPEGMVESAMEFVRICHELDFHNIVISMKASRAPVMLAAYRLMADTMDKEGFNYPLHLGVTEAGDGDYGRIKSTAGIATLLADGLGDTLRVSLTEAPEKEIPVCYSILQSLGLRKTMVEYVACPSCGRTLFNLEEVLHKVRDATQHLQGLDIAVMGCIVNGPGEMADADYGYVGKGPGTIALYRGREEIRKVPEAEGVEALIQLIKEDGRWVDPPDLVRVKISPEGTWSGVNACVHLFDRLRCFSCLLSEVSQPPLASALRGFPFPQPPAARFVTAPKRSSIRSGKSSIAITWIPRAPTTRRGGANCAAIC